VTVRVLVLSNLYPPNAMGGYELSCRDVVDRWRSRGHEVDVLTTSGQVDGVVEPDNPGPHVHRDLRWYWSQHQFVRPDLRSCLLLERANHEALDRALQRCRPDVVSVWHMGGMSLSLLSALDERQVPWVGNICDDWPSYGPRADAWMRFWNGVRRPLAGAAARIAGVPTRLPDLDRHAHSVVSSFTREQVRSSTRWKLPRSVVVGSGIDLVDFPLAASATTKPWRGELLAVGRVEPRKGFDSAVRALAYLPAQTLLRIAGVAEPAHLAELRDIAATCGVADRLVVEAVPRAQLRRLYAAADAVLFPSRWQEPFGLVPLEAMSQATPVVATRQGGSAEYLVNDGNCLEVPVDDPRALAAAVNRLAGDEDLRLRLASEGLRTAHDHTVDRLADELEQLHLAEVGRC
jgi:glycosyltransferase involved in cell wall biosynthesis